MKKIVFLWSFIAVVYYSSFYAAEHKKCVVLAVDLGLLIPNDDMNTIITNALTSGLWIIASHPSLLIHVREIVDIGKSAAKTTRGMSNIISAVTNSIKNDFDVTLNREEQENMIAISVAPVLKKAILAQLQELKGKGFILIGFTNRDNYELRLCKESIQKNNHLNIESLFDGIVSVQCWDTAQQVGPQDYYAPRSNYIIAQKPFPNNEFINALAKVINNATSMALSGILIFPQRVYDTTSPAQINALIKEQFPSADISVATPPTKENKDSYAIAGQASAFVTQLKEATKKEEKQCIEDLD